MKNLIVVALLSLTLSGIAQEKRAKNQVEHPELSMEQRTELQVKKLTLELDLSLKQQKEIATIVANQQAKREAFRIEVQNKRAENKKATADEKFAMRSKMLDERIAYKNEMKKVLSTEQLAKWEDMSKKMERMDKSRMKRNQRNEK